MKRHFILLALAALAPLAAGPGTAQSAESFDSCKGTIASLPAVIGSPGTWCLSASLATAASSGAAITINTNNVTIDCNHFIVSGLPAGPATATIGVLAEGRINIGVRNCHLRGFRFAIQGSGSTFLVRDNRIEGATIRGVFLSGDALVVSGNQVVDIGGSTIGNGSAMGMSIAGTGRVSNNNVTGVAARDGSGQAVWGIHVGDDGAPAQMLVEDNSVRALVPDGGALAVAIRSTAGGRVSLRRNALFGEGTGIGMQCANADGAVRDNSLLGFATAISGCSSDGGNTVKP